MSTSTFVPSLKINTLTQAQFDTSSKSNNELWFITDSINPQSETMPTASADCLNAITQYVGTTTATYTNGYFYKCVSDGQTPATYSWEQTDVQPAGGSSYTAGTGIDITDNTISVTDPVMTNKTRTQDVLYGTLITAGSTNTIQMQHCTLLNTTYRTNLSSGGATFLGDASGGANGNMSCHWSTAVGYSAKVSGNGSVMLGTGTNPTAGTFAVGIGYSSSHNVYELLSADGTIPADRLIKSINKYSTMPTAASTNVGWIVQYIGTTDTTYTHGYIYECVSDGQTPAAYSWSRIDVQPNGGISTIAFSDITGQPSDNANLNTALNAKQNTLTAGTNITISGSTISATDTTYTAGTGISISGSNVISSTVTVPTKISDLTDDTATNPIDKADTLTGLTATVAELNTLDGITASTTELNYTTGVTSNIQTQLDAKQSTLTAGNNITITTNTISATDTTYTAGNGLNLTGTTFAIDNAVVATQTDLATKQDTLTAGNNITISGSTISATDTTYTAGTGIDITNGVISNTQSAGVWGSITGTLSNQTDLQTALDAKQGTLTAGNNIQIAADGTISATDTTYTVGAGLAISGTQISANITDNVISSSTTTSLSARQGKILQDQINNLSNIGKFLALWDATTGLPTDSTSITSGYAYQRGDYFIVTVVGITNYKPDGSTYTGTASTVVESGTVSVGYTYFYDGTNWLLNTSRGEVVSVNGQTGVVTLDIDDVAPAQAGQTGKFLTTDGTNASWGDPTAVIFKRW